MKLLLFSNSQEGNDKAHAGSSNSFKVKLIKSQELSPSLRSVPSSHWVAASAHLGSSAVNRGIGVVSAQCSQNSFAADFDRHVVKSWWDQGLTWSCPGTDGAEQRAGSCCSGTLALWKPMGKQTWRKISRNERPKKMNKTRSQNVKTQIFLLWLS